ncbi:pentapeptide repeat-containing protein [Pseudanabaena sp. 'Roaring Creek']|uniref:pentapeptide repeat-containing protein n=1 Tax=Pseudanabaena sp. 'Roaring Creek' TaxID=1681830 RepID=UPI0034DD3FBC
MLPIPFEFADDREYSQGWDIFERDSERSILIRDFDFEGHEVSFVYDLRYCDLRYCDLRYCDLRYCDLRYCDLRYKAVLKLMSRQCRPMVRG